MKQSNISITKTIVESILANVRFVLRVVALLPILILAVVIIAPSSLLFMNEKEIQQNKSEIANVTQRHFYDGIGKNKQNQIIALINEKYQLSITDKDVFQSGNDGFRLMNNGCDLYVEYAPSASLMTDCISAYINAVDSTILEYSDNDTFDTKDILNLSNTAYFDGDGNIAIKDELLKLASTTISTVGEYEIFLSRNKGFVLDGDCPDRWDCDVEIKENWIVKKPGTSTEEEIIVNGPVGTITIYIYYDLSQYRIRELKEIESRLSEKSGVTEISSEKANQLISATLYQNYASYFSISDSVDNREQLFENLLKKGCIVAVPISGLNSAYLNFGVSDNGVIENIVNGSTETIWNHIGELRNKGILSTNATRYNCTEFANYWFYCLYGKGHILMGDGNQMVDSLMNSNYGKEHFEKSYSPSVGAIFSISSLKGEGGHVGCIDGVDYENMTITISHANYGGAGSIHLREVMSFSEFEEMVNGFGDGTSIIFAKPIKETFINENCCYTNWLLNQ